MLDPTNFIVHFGCRGSPGHYLTTPGGSGVRDNDAERIKIPRDHSYDGSRAFLPYPERVGHGALTYLPANDRTILAWWDRTFDGRGACNMALIVAGKATADEIWQRMLREFADLRGLTMPTLVQR